MIMYKLINSLKTKKPNCVRRLSDGASIPFDEENTDYQVYLKWLEKGNIPEEAE